MTPQPKTTLFPTSAETLGAVPSAVWAKPTIIWADVGGTITVVPFDSNSDASVAFTIGDQSCVPVMVKQVVSVGAATGLKRIY